jgi:hypothetical protein
MVWSKVTVKWGALPDRERAATNKQLQAVVKLLRALCNGLATLL